MIIKERYKLEDGTTGLFSNCSEIPIKESSRKKLLNFPISYVFDDLEIPADLYHEIEHHVLETYKKYGLIIDTTDYEEEINE